MRLSFVVAVATATSGMSQIEIGETYGDNPTCYYGQEPTCSDPKAPKFSDLKMTIPNIARDFILECDLNPSIPLGSGPGDTKYNWISFAGGTWNATWGSGTIEHGGHDYQFVLPDLSAKATTQYLLKTSDEDPAYIEIQSDGWIKGPLDVMQSLNNASTRDDVDPSSYYFRLMVSMNTGDERYNHVNTSLWVASARRMTGKVVFEAYIVG